MHVFCCSSSIADITTYIVFFFARYLTIAVVWRWLIPNQATLRSLWASVHVWTAVTKSFPISWLSPSSVHSLFLSGEHLALCCSSGLLTTSSLALVRKELLHYFSHAFPIFNYFLTSASSCHL